MRFTAEARGYLKCKISPRLTFRGGRTRTEVVLRIKISWIIRKPNFLIHGAPLCARESSTINVT